jgi:hypothetical protein
LTTSQLTDSEQQLTDALIAERELRSRLVEALEGLEDGWVRPGDRAWWHCTVCDHESHERGGIDHQTGCPVPPAYAALEAARALSARS